LEELNLEGMWRRSVSILSILVVAISYSGYAQTCCSGGVPLSGNIGLPRKLTYPMAILQVGSYPLGFMKLMMLIKN